ncbi:hypothetical protein O181_055566 [Austropuccinia psidii MF-1]|uniref:Uncharacterized protein n=1 Tax=Austropuccinia psidii MF-1 TaxID=1389203 RepID=A0A9Q3E4P2_9BASI|nr:hypothetical protein [Austropuccinia psidii MF-1]
MQREFCKTDPRISEAIGTIPGYQEGNWSQLKKILMTKWERVEPERRYRKDSPINLFNNTLAEWGISTLYQYERLIGECEAILTYILRYKHIPQYNMFHEDLFDCLSSDLNVLIIRYMIKDNVMVRAKNGGYLIPPINILKNSIGKELEGRILVTKRLSTAKITGRNETKLKDKKGPIQG